LTLPNGCSKLVETREGRRSVEHSADIEIELDLNLFVVAISPDGRHGPARHARFRALAGGAWQLLVRDRVVLHGDDDASRAELLRWILDPNAVTSPPDPPPPPSAG
jgi:hypothetical protein